MSLFASTAFMEPLTSIAVDWMARNLYYSSNKSIGVIKLDGGDSYYHQILRSNFDATPKALVVNPAAGSVAFMLSFRCVDC